MVGRKDIIAILWTSSANEEEERYGKKRKTLLFLLRYTLYLIRVKKIKPYHLLLNINQKYYANVVVYLSSICAQRTSSQMLAQSPTSNWVLAKFINLSQVEFSHLQVEKIIKTA